MCEIPVGRRLTLAAFVLASDPSELPSLLPREGVSLGVDAASDLSRKPTVMPRHGEWSARSFVFILVGLERTPLRTVVDLLIVEYEATVLADSFGSVSDDTTVAFGTLVCGRISLYVLVEGRLVDVSRSHRFHRSFREDTVDASLTHSG